MRPRLIDFCNVILSVVRGGGVCAFAAPSSDVARDRADSGQAAGAQKRPTAIHRRLSALPSAGARSDGSHLLNYVPFAEQLLSRPLRQVRREPFGAECHARHKFMQDRAQQLSSGRAKLLVTGLRSFLRYLRHQGEISRRLGGCVPPVAVWSLSAVPKFLPAGRCNGCSSLRT